MSSEGGGFSGPCYGHAQITEAPQRVLAVGTAPLPAELVCERVELADGAGALPLLKHTHVGGASLRQRQDAITEVDVVEPQAAEGGVQHLVGLPGWRGLRASAHTIDALTAPLRTAQQPSKPTARAKPTAQGPRAKGLKDQEGSLGGGDSRGERRRW